MKTNLFYLGDEKYSFDKNEKKINNHNIYDRLTNNSSAIVWHLIFLLLYRMKSELTDWTREHRNSNHEFDYSYIQRAFSDVEQLVTPQ